MIIHGKVFKRIEKIAKTKKDYKYILLYFVSDKIELIFSSVDENTLNYLLSHFPLLVIYDEERHDDNMNSNLIDDIFEDVLNRRISDSNKKLIMQVFNCIDYDYLIDEKDKILQKINHVLILNNILGSLNTLNVNFLSKSNMKSIRKRTNLSTDEFIQPSAISGSLENYNYVSGLMKKNINKILDDNNALELKEFFYYPKLKKTLNKSEKEDLKKETNFFKIQDKLDLLNKLKTKEISKRPHEIYNEILLECKYVNLYTYDFDMKYGTYEYLYDTLYCSMKYNKITALSTVFIDEDYLKTMIEYEVNSVCFDEVLKKMYDTYGFDFTSYSYEDIRQYTMKEMNIQEENMHSQYSDFQMLDSYMEDTKQEIQEESQKLEDECMENSIENTQKFLEKYLKSLKVGKFKHKKS